MTIPTTNALLAASMTPLQSAPFTVTFPRCVSFFYFFDKTKANKYQFVNYFSNLEGVSWHVIKAVVALTHPNQYFFTIVTMHIAYV